MMKGEVGDTTPDYAARLYLPKGTRVTTKEWHLHSGGPRNTEEGKGGLGCDNGVEMLGQQEAVQGEQGDCLIHCGQLLHGGAAVTAGRRVVLVSFIDELVD